MDDVLTRPWAKTAPYPGTAERWHPLLLHLLDVAAVADAILEREPEATRKRMASLFGLEWSAARPWLLFLIGAHDIGKASPSFQSLFTQPLEGSGLPAGRTSFAVPRHGVVSQTVLEVYLVDQGFSRRFAGLAADAVGSHHGQRASESAIGDAELEQGRASPTNQWHQVRLGLLNALKGAVGAQLPAPTRDTLSGPDYMLLAGLTSFADWIGSNEAWFPFGVPSDCLDPLGWFSARRAAASKALDALGWLERSPLTLTPATFESVIGKVREPRPLQLATATAVADAPAPPVILIEAPMGEGKTEAAFYAHLELQRRFGHRGLYLALPTRATGNAMFNRARTFLENSGSGRILDLQLLHGSTQLNDKFQELRNSRIEDEDQHGGVRAAEWFTHRKRALLSEYGVGTIDQALMAVLPVRHHTVRLWGLANRVVVLDEVHAYDAYTGTLLLHLIGWLQALDSSVVVLSATLPPATRRALAKATSSPLPDVEVAYPRVTVFSRDTRARQYAFAPTEGREVSIRVHSLGEEVVALRDTLSVELGAVGAAACIVNTVDRAQSLYTAFPAGEPVYHGGSLVGKRLSDGTEVLLFHARFPANERKHREDAALEAFGPDKRTHGRAILIATQVAEQSLDLDFDLLVTDLAPVDLVLQRAGRLWRHHERTGRGVSHPQLFIAGTSESRPPSFAGPLWWGAVYDEAILLRTWVALKPLERIAMPDDIESLVEKVYEERVEIPAFLQERLDKAVPKSDGTAISHRQSAHAAIIGLPDDGSWNNDPGRNLKYDDERIAAHPSLLAQTRLGRESVTVIPIAPACVGRIETAPSDAVARDLVMRSLTVSRPQVVRQLRTAGVPAEWEKVPLLRNSVPLLLDEEGAWVVDPLVRLDPELGLVYLKAGT